MSSKDHTNSSIKKSVNQNSNDGNDGNVDDDRSFDGSSEFSEALEITDGSIRDDLSASKRTLENEERQKLAVQSETRAVYCLRLLLGIMLLLSAVGCSLVVYYHGVQKAEKYFEKNFLVGATKLLEGFSDNVMQTLKAADALGVSITSYALLEKATTTTRNSTVFPNVTLPNIVIQGSVTRVLGGGSGSSGGKNGSGIMINWLPLVTDETRKGWEEYSVLNQQWIDNSYREQVFLQARQSTRFSNNNDENEKLGDHGENSPEKEAQSSSSSLLSHDGGHENTIFHNQIFRYSAHSSQTQAQAQAQAQQQLTNGYHAEPEGSGPYLPLWQLSPVLLSMKNYLNLNLLSHPTFADSLLDVLSSEKVVMSPTMDLGGDDISKMYYHYYNDNKFNSNANTETTRYNTTTPSDSVTSHPALNIFYPVLTELNYDDDVINGKKEKKREVAGILMISLYWTLFLENILPDGMDGYVCVLENTAAHNRQTYTYQVDGSTVRYLGQGDLHDTRYDDHDDIALSIMMNDDIMTYIERSMMSHPEQWSFTSVELLLNDENDNNNELITSNSSAYKLSIYPSPMVEEKCRKERPIVIVIIIGSIFLLTVITCILYDLKVERRQKLVMNQAVASNALISSLFPENVRERLFEEDNLIISSNSRVEESTTRYINSQGHPYNTSSKRRGSNDSCNNMRHGSNHSCNNKRRGSNNSCSIKSGNDNKIYDCNNTNGAAAATTTARPSLGERISSLNSDSTFSRAERRNSACSNIMSRMTNVVVHPLSTFAAVVAASNSQQTSVDCSQSLGLGLKPIAEFFSSTTIMFGDLAGFTAWSATRKPEEVFELLERLYGAFDTMAMRRKVFKVETVGDCYVAVTGLPEPQPDHAVIMSKFARDCLIKMKEIVNQLKYSLGEDTATLSMRIGLHSGGVTAGVLRGQKSRFQLFGDAMNTASRIETSGMAGRIHISQETADLLIGHDKINWIKVREDKIFAKGKGEMQTYWIDMENIRRRESGETQ